jgi:uncharacterized protein YbjT (DUF2867 family)
MISTNRRVLVTGGGTFLGDNIAAALLAEGAEVTMLVRPDMEVQLGSLKSRVRLSTADVWDAASLRGRARNHACVINTIGSLTDDPAQGLTYHRLNFVSARNIVNMCISDGVPHMIFMSSASAPWISGQYLNSKREAEDYVDRVGVSATVIRAPLLYVRGKKRPLFYEMMTLLGGWLGLGRIAPMPVDVAARAIARIALDIRREKKIYYAADLRRRNKREELRGAPLSSTPPAKDATQPRRPHGAPADDDAPFGWVPPKDTRK